MCPYQTDTARELRRNQTDAEALLWSKLRSRRLAGHKFRRQVPVGPFVVDFACTEMGLAVEIDGGQHAGATGKDEKRTGFLERRGYRVIRFWNHEVLSETEAVLARLLEVLNKL